MRHGVIGPEPHVDDIPRRQDVRRRQVATVAADVTGLRISAIVNLSKNHDNSKLQLK